LFQSLSFIPQSHFSIINIFSCYLTIFIIFIAGLSLSCFSLAFYIQRNGGIIDYEATKVFT